MRASRRKGFLIPYPPVIQPETMRRAVQTELAVLETSEPTHRAPWRVDLSYPLARRAASEPGSDADDVRRLEGRFVLTGYRSWH